MSDTQQQSTYAEKPYDVAPGAGQRRATPWVGFLYFAATMAMLVGAFQATQGLVALFRDDYYVVTRSGLLVTMDYTAWGWVHLVIGLILFGTGVGIMLGQMWARVTGIVIASVSALANIAFLPAYPLWCTVVIAMDVLIIYALTVHGREPKYT